MTIPTKAKLLERRVPPKPRGVISASEMTIREHMATSAMQGLLANALKPKTDEELARIAQQAVKLAEQLLTALKETQ